MEQTWANSRNAHKSFLLANEPFLHVHFIFLFVKSIENSWLKYKTCTPSQVLKIENDCVHHPPRNSVTLDASVALDKFDRKRKKIERRKKEKITHRRRYPEKRGNDCKISRLCLYCIRILFWNWHSEISTRTDSTL